ncbi:MAG: homoserine dehydrogenase [Firmicutes bacterium ZCTH02-B6]|nr:MAG: homoserine dehydrogenase [Firmicutes bacterium ZCTH02-B6]
MEKPVQVGLLGCGTVGSGVLSILQANAERIAARAGALIEVRRVAVRDLKKYRTVSLDEALLTTDPWEVVSDPSVDIVIEVMGGVDPARDLIAAAVDNGKPVITANKEVLAKHGPELLSLAARRGVDLFFEGSVAGGIPIIKPLRESLAANRVQAIVGIINGTTNYVLTRMSREGMPFAEVLREAQALGYAEADPASDVEGYDAAFKIAILASLAFETPVRVEDVYCEGITRITPEDIRYGRELGYEIKLLAIAREHEGRLEVRVHPAFIPAAHPLAAVTDVFNAIFVRGDAVGELMFYGRGAGSLPTGSAVVADLVDAVRRLRFGGNGRLQPPAAQLPIKPIEETVSRYYVSLKVVDRPGVLAKIAAAFGENDVSIDSVIQKGRLEDPVDLVFVTHEVQEANIRRALAQISRLPVVRQVSNVIRVEAEV